jgi:hypothetical protein
VTSVRAFPEPRPPNFGKPMWCKWCGDPIPKVIDGKSSTQRLWHPACKDEYFLHTRLEQQFQFLVARDGERCACCHTEEPMKWGSREAWVLTTNSVWRQGASAKMLDWTAMLWERPEKPWQEWTDEDRTTGLQQEIYRTSSLEVDHRVPLWEVADLPDEERRWYFGPGNLWLLCPKCHKAKTAREAARRAHERRMAHAQLALPLWA